MNQKQETVRSQKLALLTLGQPFQSVVTMTRTSEHVQTEAGRTPPGATRVAHTGTHPRAAARTRTHRSAVRESVWQGGRRPGREAPGGGDRST